MVPPHGTSCLTCSVEPLGYRAGVPLAGVADTAPGTIPADVASDGAASPPTLTATAPAITPARLNIWIPPTCTEHPQMKYAPCSCVPIFSNYAISVSYCHLNAKNLLIVVVRIQ